MLIARNGILIHSYLLLSFLSPRYWLLAGHFGLSNGCQMMVKKTTIKYNISIQIARIALWRKLNLLYHNINVKL